jgi:predicted ester cyclase
VFDFVDLGDGHAAWTVHVTGTFSGEFMGIAGQGQKIDLWLSNAARIVDGKAAEHWGLSPQAAQRLFTQMGVDTLVPR